MTKLTIILSILSLSLFAQTKREIVVSVDSDTSFLQYRTFPEKDLRLSQAERSFRLSTSCNSVEIRKNQSTFSGELSLFVREVSDFESSSKTHRQTYSLDPLAVQKMFHLIDSLKLDNIPSDTFIKSWRQGFDGIVYVLESKDKVRYSCKGYWTPEAQMLVVEALTIQAFVDRVYALANLKARYENFDTTIPFMSWTCNGVIVSRIMTRKEYRAYKRKKRRLNKTAVKRAP